MDPLAVLGVPEDASSDQVAAAYRALAKRWHPDRSGGGQEALRRMAEINAAYDLVRQAGTTRGPGTRVRTWDDGDADGDLWGDEARGTAEAMSRAEQARRRQRTRRRAGWWLPDSVRRALGAELTRALRDEELVLHVRITATWHSPQAILALTDRRLLWLADDAVTDRVHALKYADVTGVQARLRRPFKRTAILRVTNLLGRRFDFAELAPDVAEELAAEVRARAPRLQAARL